MEKSISAADAKQGLSRVLRNVGRGQTYVITCRGQAIARIEPIPRRHLATARARLLKRLKAQPVTRIGQWKRAELYK